MKKKQEFIDLHSALKCMKGIVSRFRDKGAGSAAVQILAHELSNQYAWATVSDFEAFAKMVCSEVTRHNPQKISLCAHYFFGALHVERFKKPHKEVKVIPARIYSPNGMSLTDFQTRTQEIKANSEQFQKSLKHA